MAVKNFSFPILIRCSKYRFIAVFKSFVTERNIFINRENLLFANKEHSPKMTCLFINNLLNINTNIFWLIEMSLLFNIFHLSRSVDFCFYSLRG